MKWVQLSCKHLCWIPWLEAFPGREVECPGDDKNGRRLCQGTSQTVVAEREFRAKLVPVRKETEGIVSEEQSAVSIVDRPMALVNHPDFGSLWLMDAYLVKTTEGDYVIGEAWDDTDAGSPFMPDDYNGQTVTMNFPATCIRKRTGDLEYRE